MVGVNQQNMNGTNRFLLLKTIATQGPVSRIGLSKATGLSKMTVTSLVGEYFDAGIIRECGKSVTLSGRKPKLLELVPDSLLTMGVDIGRDFIEVGIVDLCGKVQFYEHVAMVNIHSSEALLSAILGLCNNIISKTNKSKVWGIGISSIGPIDIEKGIIVNPPDFNGITNVQIVSALKEHFDLPVYLENDMCVSALAELYYGNGSSYDKFLYMGISAGIGGGIVLNRQLYRGARGFAGMLGHTVVETDGEPCQCGNKGCFEAYSSVRAAVRFAKEHGAPKDLTWMMLLKRAEDGDTACVQAIEHMYRYIEMVIFNAVTTLDVQCVFIGGDIWYGSKFFLERLNNAIKQKLFAREIRENIPVILSQFSANATFIGTAALVMENNLSPKNM